MQRRRALGRIPAIQPPRLGRGTPQGPMPQPYAWLACGGWSRFFCPVRTDPFIRLGGNRTYSPPLQANGHSDARPLLGRVPGMQSGPVATNESGGFSDACVQTYYERSARFNDWLCETPLPSSARQEIEPQPRKALAGHLEGQRDHSAPPSSFALPVDGAWQSGDCNALGFHQARKELTTLPVLLYSSGH